MGYIEETNLSPLIFKNQSLALTEIDWMLTPIPSQIMPLFPLYQIQHEYHHSVSFYSFELIEKHEFY